MSHSQLDCEGFTFRNPRAAREITKLMSNFAVMKRSYVILLMILVGAMNAGARTKDEVMAKPYEIRVGWADQLFEQVVWRDELPYVMAASQSRTYKQNYKYSQHHWMEYQQSFAPWFSAGMLVDHSSVHWDNVVINGAGEELDRYPYQKFYNLILMPSMRVTYYHWPHIEIYSELGLGFDINGGTEKNEKGRRTSLGYGYDFRPVGVRFNAGPFFSSFDFGRTFALRDSDHVFLAFGRIFSASIGYSFGLSKKTKSQIRYEKRITPIIQEDNEYGLSNGYSSGYLDDYEEAPDDNY